MTTPSAAERHDASGTHRPFDLSVIVVGGHDVGPFVTSLSSLIRLEVEYPEMRTQVVLVAEEEATGPLREGVAGDVVVVTRGSAPRGAAVALGRSAAAGKQQHVLVAGEELLEGPARGLAAKCGAVPEVLRTSSGSQLPLAQRLQEMGLQLSGDFDGSLDDVLIEGPTALHAGLRAFRPMEIGAFTYSWSPITGAVERIGRYCSIARGVSFGESEHPTDALSTSPFGFDDGKHLAAHMSRTGRSYVRRQLSMDEYHSPVVVGNDVWIGAQAYVKGGVVLGDGCIVGTSAVVTKDVPPYAVVVGNPGRVVRQRFDDNTVERLVALEWWRYDCADFDGFDLTDVEVAIDRIGRGVEDGSLRPYRGYQRSVGDIVRHLES